jgi:hypothetical protein
MGISVRNVDMNARRLWFAGLWLLFPWTLPVYGDAFVPAARYVLLAFVTSAIAITEGSSGPVGLIMVLFVGWGLITTLLSAGMAWLISKALSNLPPRQAAWVTAICLALGFAFALIYEPYRTPFGRALTGGLLEILS